MNLLVVDDEVITTEVLKDRLDRKLLQLDHIYTAYNVTMAKQILEQNQMEIILCDVEMPQANGLELLEWIREKRLEAEFLFLTSHEKFEYAFGAMKNGAANYLLKPIDIPKINQALLTVTEKIRKNKQIGEIKEYWNYRKRKVIRDFWKNTILGNSDMPEEEIKAEIGKLGLEPYIKTEYAVILFHLKKEEIFYLKGNSKLDWFILDNIFAEAFTADFSMENVIHWSWEDECYVIVFSDIETGSLSAQMEKAREALNLYYQSPLYAAYISDRRDIFQLGKMSREMIRYDRNHLNDEGSVFWYSMLKKNQGQLEKMLDQKFVLQCLEKGERVKLLEYLQKVIVNAKKKDQSLRNRQFFQMNLVQVINVFLYRHEMDTEILLSDQSYLEMKSKALTSEFFMIRWTAYLVNKVFDGTQDRNQGKGIADVVVDYIRSHFDQNITRTELADLVHFSPEYVGKIFKRQMGIGINDYINSLRIEKAKELLQTTNDKVIDIGLMVGFENMPYFSSVFKKYTGMSPAEYKKNTEKK